MKQKIILKLRNNKVLQRIATHTYYTGEARKAAGAPPMAAAHIQASHDDNRQLGDHLAVACNEIAQLLSTYIAICHTQESDEAAAQGHERVTLFILEAPANYPKECARDIEQTIENYAVARTLQQWLVQNKPDESLPAANEAQQHLTTLRQMAALRRRPQRREAPGRKIIDF